MKGIIGKKVGMTHIFGPEGEFIPVTVVLAGPCVVTQIKTKEIDGYTAVQLAYGEKKEKNTPKAEMGHFAKANTTPKREVAEFRDFDLALNLGESIDTSIFNEGEKVSVIGTSKGKGFQGVVRRHNFSGVGMRSHGQHDRHRAPGSIGASSFPSKVIKGMRMAGRMGGDTIKTKNLKIAKIMAEQNLILLNGSVPGHNGAFIKIVSK
jgi:large subunit ribosomal protein L3